MNPACCAMPVLWCCPSCSCRNGSRVFLCPRVKVLCDGVPSWVVAGLEARWWQLGGVRGWRPFQLGKRRWEERLLDSLMLVKDAQVHELRSLSLLWHVVALAEGAVAAEVVAAHGQFSLSMVGCDAMCDGSDIATFHNTGCHLLGTQRGNRIGI